MKTKYLFLFLFLNYFGMFAQKQTYLLFAYGQKSINMVCGEKVMLKKEEIKLLPAELVTYRATIRAEIKANYGKDLTNIFVELIPSNQAIIFYEFEKTFTKQKDSWDCTNTQYHCAKGKDMLAAERSFANQKAQYGKLEFKELWRWGSQAKLTPAALGENDLDVDWKSISSGYLLTLGNKRTDIALQVTIVGFKNRTKETDNTDISKMTKDSETLISLEPNSIAKKTMPSGDAFEIRIIQKVATPAEKEGLLEKTKQLWRSYVREKNGNIKSVMAGFGVRG